MKNDNGKYYGAYLARLNKVQEELIGYVYGLLGDLTENSETTPVEHIVSRIKSPDSVMEKLERLGYPTDAKSALVYLSDLVGGRIVTHFVGDVYTILNRLQEEGEWQIIEVKDYISSPKPNGYRSLHVILRVPFGDEEIPFIAAELQLRTIAMDCWASLEHQMRYKKHISNTKLIEAELKRCADEMASTDLSMQTIREMIQNQ